jgi:hypothetical protein
VDHVRWWRAPEKVNIWTFVNVNTVSIIIAASSGAIAAVSSLKNGKTLNGLKPKVDQLATGKPRKKKTSKDGSIDWHVPLDLK